MEVVFDVRTASFSFGVVAALLAALCAGVVLEVARRWRKYRIGADPNKTANLVVSLLAAAVVLLMSFLRLDSYRREKDEFVEVLSTNRARVIEGEISGYEVQPWTGRPMESFRIGVDTFSFDGFGTSPAYHRRALAGGPLGNGLRVRLSEFQGNILRVEVLGRGSSKPE